jgi:hypothetical protein
MDLSRCAVVWLSKLNQRLSLCTFQRPGVDALFPKCEWTGEQHRRRHAFRRETSRVGRDRTSMLCLSVQSRRSTAKWRGYGEWRLEWVVSFGLRSLYPPVTIHWGEVVVTQRGDRVKNSSPTWKSNPGHPICFHWLSCAIYIVHPRHHCQCI